MKLLRNTSSKIALGLAALVLLTVIGVTASLTLAWSAEEKVVTHVSGSIDSLVTASDIETALRRQRGFTGNFIISGGDERWLEELASLEDSFRALLDGMSAHFGTGEERRLIAETRAAYAEFDASRREVVRLMRAGDRNAAVDAYLSDLYTSYVQAAEAAYAVFDFNASAVDGVLDDTNRDLSRLTAFVAVDAALVILLAAALGWALYTGVFRPLRELALEASLHDATRNATILPQGDPLETLGNYMNALLADVERSRSDLNLSRRELAQAERMVALGGAVAELAHEIKNRLFIIEGYANMIAARDASLESAKKHADLIIDGSGRLKEMMKEIMDFSRPTALDLREVDPKDLLTRMARTFIAQAPAGVVVALDIDPSTPDVPLNEARIEQVLVNLARNALEAVGERGAITLTAAPAPGGGAILTVGDDGPGMDAETKANLFRPFFTTKRKGSGLGLAISRRIVEDHGGTIEVESAPGLGTVVTVTFLR